MEKNLKIEKLSDIVAWADGKIRDGGYYEEKYNNDASTAYCHVKAYELWRIRDAALKGMERHSVYTDALNKDIADKAAKIELLEKEIEGRKEGYVALKVLMDTKYISIDDHNDVCKAYEKKVVELKKEIEKWQDLAKMNRDTICDQYNVCEEFKNKITELEEKVKRQRENLDGINKTLDIRNKENDSLVKTIQTTRREIEDHEAENARLSEKIMKLHDTITELSHDIDNYKSWNASLHKDIKELKEEVKKRDKCIMDKNVTINTANDDKEKLENQVKYLEKELNETCACKELDLKGHQRREASLVNALADKNDEIRKLKESIEEWKNKERIRTNQLRATESKVEELHKQIENLKKECKAKSEMIRKAYARYIDEACKSREEIKDECYKELAKDDGYLGFREYTLRALKKTKGDAKEAKEYLCNAADVIIYVKKAQERRKEEETKKELNDKFGVGGIVDEFKEETEVKGNGRTSSGRYPWGAKVNDIPCGEDSIE